MKKFLVLLCLGVFFVSCQSNTENTNTGTIVSQTGTTVDAEHISALKTFMETLAPYMKKTVADVQETKASYEEYRDLDNLAAYSIKNEKMTSKEAFDIDVYSMFDGWSVATEHDPVIGFYTEYVGEDFICSLGAEPNNDDAVSAFLNAENEEAADAQYSLIDFSVTVKCSQKPKERIARTDINFVAFGQHPAWLATMDHHGMTLETPLAEQESLFFEIGSWKKEKENYMAKADNERGTLSVMLRKEVCVNAAGENEPFTANIQIDDQSYEGCAESIHSAFTDRKMGRLASLLRTTKLPYTGSISPEYAKYIVSTKGELVSIALWDERDRDEKLEYIVFRLENDSPNIFWTGGDTVSSEVCEETRFVK